MKNTQISPGGWIAGTWFPAWFSFYTDYNEEVLVFLCIIGDTSLWNFGVLKLPKEKVGRNMAPSGFKSEKELKHIQQSHIYTVYIVETHPNENHKGALHLA